MIKLFEQFNEYYSEISDEDFHTYYNEIIDFSESEVKLIKGY